MLSSSIYHSTAQLHQPHKAVKHVRANQSASTASKQTELARASMSSICSSLCSQNQRRNRNIPGQKYVQPHCTGSRWCAKDLPLFSSSDLNTMQHSSFSFVHIRRCMYAASRLFSWIMELLAFASRLFAPNILDHQPSVTPFHSSLWASVAGGTARYATRLRVIIVHTWYIRTW